VAKDIQIRENVLRFMSSMPAVKRFNTNACQATAYVTDTHKTVAIDRHGLYRSIPKGRVIQLPVGSHMPNDIDGSPDSGEHQNDGQRAVSYLPQGSSETPQVTGEYRIRQRFEVHIHLVERTAPNPRSKIAHVDIVSSANGWSNRMSKSFYQTDIPVDYSTRPTRLV
jgi:hypothetical protein